MSMRSLRALVIEDEPIVRRDLIRLLAQIPGILVAGEASNGLEALERIDQERPDLLFLDVQMPELDGLGVLRRLPPAQLPGVIFVTAFSHYAVQAFDHHAIDYLLKPFDAERLRTALDRARLRLSGGAHAGYGERIQGMLSELDKTSAPRIAVRTGSRVTYLPVDRIDWIESAENYVRLHAGTRRYVVRDTLKRLETVLRDSGFARVHRSTLVNVCRVRDMAVGSSGDATLTLDTGARLTLSRRYRAAFDRQAGRPR